MYIIRPSYRYFIIQSFFDACLFIIICSINAVFFKKYLIYYFYFTVFILLTYFFICIFYKSLKFRNTVYKIKDSSIKIKYGVLFQHETYIPYTSIRYVETKCGIIQKITATKTIILYTVSGSTSIKNIISPATDMIENTIKDKKRKIRDNLSDR